MKRYDVKVYVACSLTHAPPEFREEVEKLKAKLKEVCHLLMFMGLTNDPPADVYQHDIVGCVSQSDLVVAICDYPSIGLGYEMATQAEKRRKPLLAVANRKSKISKLIQDTGLPGFDFRRYDDLQKDVFDMVIERLESL